MCIPFGLDLPASDESEILITFLPCTLKYDFAGDDC